MRNFDNQSQWEVDNTLVIGFPGVSICDTSLQSLWYEAWPRQCIMCFKVELVARPINNFMLGVYY